MESLVDLIKKISEREDDDEGGVGVDTQLYPAELLAGLRPVCTFYDSSEKARAQEEKTRAQAEKTRLKGEVILKAVHALLGDRKTGGPDGKSVSFVYPSHVVLGGAVEAELTKLGFVKDEWYEDDVKVKLSVRLGGYKFREVAEGELDEYERKSVVSQITEDGTFSDRDFDVFSCVLCDSDDWDRMLRDYDWDEEACNCTSHDPLEDFDSGGWTTATASLPCCRMCQWRERHSDYDL